MQELQGLESSAGTNTEPQLTDIQRELQNVPYDESSAYNQDVVPIGGTQVFNLYAVDNLENRIPILKTVVIRTATLTEIIDALVKSDQFNEFFEQTLLDGQWLRYSTETPYILDDFKPNTLYFNVANIDVGTSSPGVIDDPYDWANSATTLTTSAAQRQNVPKLNRKITLTCLVASEPTYLPIIKGSTWGQIKTLIDVPDFTQFPMKKFSHWSLQENGKPIDDLRTFDASSVIYAVFVDNFAVVKVNGVKYPFKTQIGTKFKDFKSRITLTTTRKLLGYSLKYNGDLISDDFVIDKDVTFYPVYEVQ